MKKIIPVASYYTKTLSPHRVTFNIEITAKPFDPSAIVFRKNNVNLIYQRVNGELYILKFPSHTNEFAGYEAKVLNNIQKGLPLCNPFFDHQYYRDDCIKSSIDGNVAHIARIDSMWVRTEQQRLNSIAQELVLLDNHLAQLTLEPHFVIDEQERVLRIINSPFIDAEPVKGHCFGFGEYAKIPDIYTKGNIDHFKLNYPKHFTLHFYQASYRQSMLVC